VIQQGIYTAETKPYAREKTGLQGSFLQKTRKTSIGVTNEQEGPRQGNRRGRSLKLGRAPNLKGTDSGKKNSDISDNPGINNNNGEERRYRKKGTLSFLPRGGGGGSPRKGEGLELLGGKDGAPEGGTPQHKKVLGSEGST